MIADLKILVIGQPFNDFSGGGITLKNLFFFIDKENRYLTTNTHRVLKNDFNLCSNVYLLGKSEVNIPLIFRPLLKNLDSGEFSDRSGINSSVFEISPSTVSKRHAKFYRFLSYLISIFDLNFLFFRITPSVEFIKWINKIKPDIIYTQLGHIEFIEFTKKVKSLVNLPIVVHIMDDWIENSAKGIFKTYWQNRIRESFKSLISDIELMMCISDDMSNEYEIRYSRKCITFHNPIDISNFNNSKHLNTFNKGSEKFVICYTGRIGFSNEKGIFRMVDAVDILNKKGYNIVFRIYTPDYLLIEKNIKYTSTELLGSISHNNIAQVLSQSHLLFLPLDFDRNSLNYTRFSFPTKASEYMISHKPILLNAHRSLAVTKHAIKFSWANIVDNDNVDSLVNTVEWIYNNYIEASKSSENGYNFANQNFSINYVAEKFLKTLEEVKLRNNNVKR